MWSHQDILQVFSINLNQWSKSFGVKRIGLFGSYTRNEQIESSDIDVIVEFNDDCLSFDNYMDLKFILEDIFKKQIDLVISDDIKPAIKQNILRSAKYAEGA
ncbi:nucleotidyltransferase family protein [Metabacillus sp. GX 13764]|uniref:nucleotidyltransferase family protein n=1 Tax=Metabacillus kandeliae TaxID=2900151 RepID=UPI001E426C3A|nr:nucleotidyltransferase family protein [Metabacillus kandeliae]MCD7036040.1 nucleotidyltransferase family protein [Metabacillus kandeliae]